MGKKTLALIIGRFQGPQDGHAHQIKEAEKIGDEVLVLVGSAGRARSWRNPFTYKERVDLLEKLCEDIGTRKKVHFLPLIDTLYDDDMWVTNVRIAVNSVIRGRDMNVVIVGYEKDETSAYLRWFGGPAFAGWSAETVGGVFFEGKTLNATDLREAVFFADEEGLDKARVKFGKNNVDRLISLINAPEKKQEFDAMREQALYIKGYKEKFAAAEAVLGYPIPINTADAVLVQSGHVLLVKRLIQPGIGLWALPGGHINPNETALEAAIRELDEETDIDIPKGVLRGTISQKNGSLKNPADTRVFDHPQRSEKGWVRTQAFRWMLEDRNQLERIGKGDQEGVPAWIPISDLRPDLMFEDHFDILQAMAPGVNFNYSAFLAGHLS